MIHRIDRVNPDVDDRVIKPNEARMATNLRFGASTEDTNLSGGTLILGNTELSFTPPAGVNKVVGVYADLEANCVYFAMYNSQGGHGIYRINGATNVVDTIIGVDVFGNNQGAFLNFQPDDNYDVSIAVIQGLLYWTDNVNEPRVINIEKGIRTMSGGTTDVYVSPASAINYAQVKRPPAAILDVFRIDKEESGQSVLYNLAFSVGEIQKEWTNAADYTGRLTTRWTDRFVNSDGIQFSYYYIYDNNEDSKLAPWSQPAFYKKDIVLQVPASEFTNYFTQLTIIKKVVFVYRVNNDGVPCVIKSIDNILANYHKPTAIPGYPAVMRINYGGGAVWPPVDRQVTFQDVPSIQTVIPNTTSLSKTPVSTDIVEQRFDSVPLLSKTNTIAQNRLNHGNYILDRNTWEGLKLELEVVQIPGGSQLDVWDAVADARSKTNYTGLFKPGGIYEIGLELLDEFGRPIGVIQNQEVKIPEMRLSSASFNVLFTSPANVPTLPQPYYDFPSNNLAADSIYNAYTVTYKISGTLPPWAKYCRVVSSGAKNVNYFHRGLTNIYYWYQNADGQNAIHLQPKMSRNPNLGSGNDVYTLLYDVPATIIVNPNAGGGSKLIYRYRGYAINKANFPVVYSQEEELYVKMGQEIYVNPVASSLWLPIEEFEIVNTQDYKVVGEEGDLWFVETPNTNIYPVLQNQGPPGNGFNSINAQRQVWWDVYTASELMRPVFYNIEIYSKRSQTETIFYQNNVIIPADQFVNATSTPITGTAIGDCYISSFTSNIEYRGGEVAVLPYRADDPGGRPDKPPISNAEFLLRAAQLPSFLGTDMYTTTPSTFGVTGVFLSMNPSTAKAENWVWQKGQPNIVNENQKEVRIDNGIIFSSPLVQGTQINGLNQFNSLDFRLAPLENGPITSLVVTNATQREPGVMLAIGANGVSSFYYDAIQLTNVDGSNNVATTTTYLASQRPLLGQYGTSRPMSVTKTPLGTVYWWSDVVNDLIRYTNAGLERLGMTFSFANYLRRTYNDNPLLITWYDQVTDEINLLGKGRQTAVFSERYKTFQGERDYRTVDGRYPERGIGIATKQFLFLEGKIWVTDVELTGTNAPASNFIFGSFKNPIIDIVTNESPAVVKRWNQIKVFGSRPNLVELEAPIDNESYGSALLSSIVDSQWINRKGDWEVAIRRASNTEGGLLAGKLMESRIIYSKFAFSAASFQKLNFIEVKSNVSIVQ